MCGGNRATRTIFNVYHLQASAGNLGKHTLVKTIKLGFCIGFTKLNCSNLIMVPSNNINHQNFEPVCILSLVCYLSAHFDVCVLLFMVAGGCLHLCFSCGKGSSWLGGCGTCPRQVAAGTENKPIGCNTWGKSSGFKS